MLISFSGTDSSGKSTQIDKIIDFYDNKGRKVKIIWSRGGYTPFFNGLKKLIRKSNTNIIPEPGESFERDKYMGKRWLKKIWLYLSLIDMIILYGIYFRILNTVGYVIVADRYIWDSHIDFNLKFTNESLGRLLLWKFLVIVSPHPDVSFILTIPADESLRRSNLKDEPFSEKLIQRKKRINLYMDLITKSKWDYVIDGFRPIDEVWSDIRNKLK